MALDAVARRYGVDPWTVLRWSPDRLGLALLTMEAGISAEGRVASEVAAKGLVVPVVVIGGR